MSKILIFTRDSENGGEAVFISKLAPYFISRGLSTTILSVIGEKTKGKEMCGIEYRFLNSKSIFNEVLPGLKSFKIINEEIKNSEMCIMFPFGWQSVLYIILFASKQKPFITSFHTNIIGRLSPNILYTAISKFMVINLAVIFAKKNIFLTEAQARRYRFWCLNKAAFDIKKRVVPNFIEQINKPVTHKKSALNIIFIGRLKKSKGFDDLLKIIKTEKTERKYTIIGNGPLKKELIGLKNVTYLGSVPNSEIIDILDKSDVFILPSYAEVFPMTVLEAMSRGLVMLMSDLPGMREIVVEGRNGFLFQPGDTVGVVAYLDKLERENGLVSQISKNNLQDIKKFSVERSVNQYLFEVKNLLQI